MLIGGIHIFLIRLPVGERVCTRACKVTLRDAFAAGVSLVLPAGWARLWWAALAVCGMHPAGQEEWRELTLRQNRLFFPHDWPQAQARRRGVSC